ncbi:MAG TPA: DNA polymerase/3'-5' exonuclease PolX [Patescibacteria group bacterium]|nr:DNA polymerase/3'-5' exonuclease PolX [Patescibacteria group bacterium]
MKPLSNAEIAAHLKETGLLYAMLGVQFKPRAYERAAEETASFGQEISALFKEKGEKGLREIPGVGPGIAEHVASLLETGTFAEYEKLKKKMPIDVLGLTRVEHVGPKTALLLYKALGVKDVTDLERAAKAGKIAGVPGLGKKTEENILKGVGFVKSDTGRKVLGHVLPLALEIEAALRKIPGVRHAAAAGSVRRRQETIGDLDFLVTTSKPEAAMDEFSHHREVAGVLERGPTKMVVRLRNGMHADLRVIDDASYGAALQYFTGSKDHNVLVRTLAIKKGLKLNEYGLWKGKTRVAARTEEEVYKKLGLPCFEPELRTAEGEIEAAKAKKLPKLIPYGSVRGDLQVQTSWTDGSATIAEMAAEAKKLGLDYMAVTDHTKALAMVGGLDEKRLAKQGKEIDRLNASSRGFRTLKGTECDILKDGRMDLNDAALASLDFVGASVHSHFNLPEAAQTARVIAAMKNPHVDCVFHPTGRVIGQRPPYAVDILAILKAAKATGTALEIDAYPDRSDLRDEHVRMAVKLGVKLIIDTDAHHPSHLQYLDLGIAIARRGWAEKKDVLNTRPLKEFLKWLRTPKAKRR